MDHANASSYGWFSDDGLRSQEKGFFIDEYNRILYWPKWLPAGYIIPKSYVTKLVGISLWPQFWFLFFGFAMILLGAIPFEIQNVLEPILGTNISARSLFFASCYIYLLALWILYLGVVHFVLYPQRRKKAHKLLRGHTQQPGRRPKPAWIKFTIRRRCQPFVFYYFILLISVSGSVLLYLASDLSQPIGNMLTKAAYGLSFLSIAMYGWFRERMGITRSQIWYYMPKTKIKVAPLSTFQQILAAELHMSDEQAPWMPPV